jgi:tRNA (cytidine/uridine-2'-O-)-methyltransferase
MWLVRDCHGQSIGKKTRMRIALFEPDIPQNTGAILRLGACFGITVDLIEPAGFLISDARLRRAGLDYIDHVRLTRHADWSHFRASLTAEARIVLLTTRGTCDYRNVVYAAGDVLLLGRESAGVPDAIHTAADLRVTIPLAPGMRSLNVAQAAAIVLAEALRQTNGFPGDGKQDG